VTAELVTRLSPAVRRIAYKHTPPHPYDRDDLYQEGMLAVVRLAERRKDELGPKAWTAYALMRAEGAMVDLMRTARWGKRWNHAAAEQPLSLDALVQAAEGEPLTVLDTVGRDDDLSSAHVSAWLDKLGDRERVVVEMALAGFNHREISERLGVHQSRISQIFRDHLRRHHGHDLLDEVA
jgi:RNA polymerase sigma factor (sigma-70 family)